MRALARFLSLSAGLFFVGHVSQAAHINYAEDGEFPFGYNWEINSQSSRSPASVAETHPLSGPSRDEGWLEVQKTNSSPTTETVSSEVLAQ